MMVARVKSGTPPRLKRERRRPARRLRALLAGAATLLAPALVRAGSVSYKPYRPETAETVSAPLLVVVAYSAIFVVLLFYVVLLFARQRRAEREIEELERKQRRSE
jgi:CcmD family protein